MTGRAVAAGPGSGLLPRLVTTARDATVRTVGVYNRLSLEIDPTPLDGPVVFVANHGFGGIFDLNVVAILAALDRLDLGRPVTVLAHQLAWTVGLGPLLESLGVQRAGWNHAEEAIDAGRHLLVLPGGDVDAAKSHRRRHRIEFDGRTGYARLAVGRQVPVVPIVTSGAGNSLYVLDEGRWLARRLRTDELLRLKTMPISLSVPWGLSPGLVGLLPYLPLPAKLRTAVLPPMTVGADEGYVDLAARVVEAMQTALTRLSRGEPALRG